MSVNLMDQLQIAARQNQMRPGRGGTWFAADRRGRWTFAPTPLGFRQDVRFRPNNGCDPLAIHADWAGPSKLVPTAGGLVRRVEFVTRPAMSSDHDGLFDACEQSRRDGIISELVGLAAAPVCGRATKNWEPPEADQLKGWLEGLRYQPTVDGDGNLRLTLKRPRCDGQLRIERAAGRLRLTLPLGQWTSLEKLSLRMVGELCGQFNTRTRLVRIAVVREAPTACRCEAQVDLSGLPYRQPLERLLSGFWQQTLRASLAGLELALRQLGLELPLVADAANFELAEFFM